MEVKPQFKTKVRSLGNSKGIIIPKSWIDVLGINDNEEIVIEIKAVNKPNAPRGFYTFKRNRGFYEALSNDSGNIAVV